MSEKLVRDLSHEAHFRMQVLLLPSNRGRDWKTLADKMGFPREEILYFECRREPVLELISSYESKGKTISELLSLLEEMERFDVIEDLKKFVEATPTLEEKQREWERCQTEAAEDTKAEAISECHDVYIAYAKDDQVFVNEIVTTLERPPYCMKVCTDYRELSDTAAKAIETQCSKVLVVLSESFNRCPDADHMVNFALHLSRDLRKTILIPILYKSCEIPRKLQIFTRLDYTSDRERQYFWKKLAASLGYDDKCNGKT